MTVPFLSSLPHPTLTYSPILQHIAYNAPSPPSNCHIYTIFLPHIYVGHYIMFCFRLTIDRYDQDWYVSVMSTCFAMSCCIYLGNPRTVGKICQFLSCREHIKMIAVLSLLLFLTICQNK